MSSSAKKIVIVATFYAVSLTCLTWIVTYFIPSKSVIYSIPIFYLTSLVFAIFSGYYLFFSNIVDLQKGKNILVPQNRDVTKRKILFILFIYSIFFILMFLYEQVSLITFAIWPILVSICLLLIFDRRLIFSTEKQGKSPEKIQKYGIRFLMTVASFASMYYLSKFIERREAPLYSSLLKDWEIIDVSIWCLPIALISSLVIADWITTLIINKDDKGFFKRSDVVLFLAIQFIVAVFLFII